MIIPLEKALNIIGERTTDNHRMLKQARRQRRTEYTDIFGIPFKNENHSNPKVSEFHLFISADLEYWERFQFKIYVEGAPEEGFDPNGFEFRIIELDDEGEPLSPQVNLAEYFEEQHGAWVDGNGFFPTAEISDDSADVEDFYDVLDACVQMYDPDDPTEVRRVNRILNAGTKLIQIEAPVACEVTLIPYIKYSTVNR